jgi:hypothetical protein
MPSALAIEYGVSPFAARWATFLRSSTAAVGGTVEITEQSGREFSRESLPYKAQRNDAVSPPRTRLRNLSALPQLDSCFDAFGYGNIQFWMLETSVL